MNWPFAFGTQVSLWGSTSTFLIEVLDQSSPFVLV
jgi:hypothetical protein